MAACLVGESGNKFNVYSYIYNRNECHLFLRSQVLTVFTVHDTRGGFLFACLLFLISTWEVAVYNRRGCINVVLQRCMQNLMRQILSKYPFPDPRFRTSIQSESTAFVVARYSTIRAASFGVALFIKDHTIHLE